MKLHWLIILKFYKRKEPLSIFSTPLVLVPLMKLLAPETSDVRRSDKLGRLVLAGDSSLLSSSAPPDGKLTA